MKPRSGKNKGAKFQKEIKELLHEYYPQIHQDDIKVSVMGESGRDIHLFGDARLLIPLSIECKNVERLNIWSAIKQAEQNATEGTLPVVFFRRNREKAKVVLDAEEFIKLLRDADV